MLQGPPEKYQPIAMHRSWHWTVRFCACAPPGSPLDEYTASLSTRNPDQAGIHPAVGKYCPIRPDKSNDLETFAMEQMIVFRERDRCIEINSDSAVAIDRKREAQSFRSEVDGFLPLSSHRSGCFEGDV
jgi:hypothetical protein